MSATIADMTSNVGASPVAAVAEAAGTLPGLRLLLLFGSRARHDASAQSDWDFGYLAEDSMDADGLLAAVVTAVGSDKVDLVDLQRAGGLLRYRAARDGYTVFEVSPDLADRFRLDAATFWCDAEPVLRRGYDEVLAELPG
jgi:predicted nucleotidyltransferase